MFLLSEFEREGLVCRHTAAQKAFARFKLQHAHTSAGRCRASASQASLKSHRIGPSLHEIANPDGACRERLVALYGHALSFDQGAVAEIVARSGGASAAFIKEMVRRFAQSALSARTGGHVERTNVAMVLGEATENRNRLGRRIVGLSNAAAQRDGKMAPPFDGCGEEL